MFMMSPCSFSTWALRLACKLSKLRLLSSSLMLPLGSFFPTCSQLAGVKLAETKMLDLQMMDFMTVDTVREEARS